MILTAFASIFCLLSNVTATAAATLPVFTLLHSFSGAGGNYPFAGLTVDANGNLYGTTVNGGPSQSGCGAGGAYSCGTIFKLKTDGTGFMLIHSFSGTDGGDPSADLILDGSGNLYGTTAWGGDSPSCPPYGCGTIFKVRTDGTGFTLLHSFSGVDGGEPAAGLILDAKGNLYGTTQLGGPNGGGTVFTIKTDATGFSLLHSFSPAFDDGVEPQAGVILDGNGELYGTTSAGGAGTACYGVGCGTVFKVKTDGTDFAILHSFSSSSTDGANPAAGVVLDHNENLYGSTLYGGTGLNCVTYGGCGTIFKVRLDGTGFALLHSFALASNNGVEPRADLILDGNGNMYGTAAFGGSNNCLVDESELGCGTIFALILHPSAGALVTPLPGPAALAAVSGR